MVWGLWLLSGHDKNNKQRKLVGYFFGFHGVTPHTDKRIVGSKGGERDKERDREREDSTQTQCILAHLGYIFIFFLQLRSVCTLGPSPRFESSLLVNVLLVSMPESLVAESWLPCRSASHRDQSAPPTPPASRLFPLLNMVAAPTSTAVEGRIAVTGGSELLANMEASSSWASKRTVFFILRSVNRRESCAADEEELVAGSSQ